MKFISYPKVINSTIFILMFLLGCNKQSEPLKYNDPIWTKDFDGYSRDMLIHNDTLFVVNEDEGLLIYKLEMDTLTNTLTFVLLYSDSPYYQNKGWNLSGILFSDNTKKVILLDGFYCTYFADLSDVFNDNTIYQPLQCAADNHHISRFTINEWNEKIDIFTLSIDDKLEDILPRIVENFYARVPVYNKNEDNFPSQKPNPPINEGIKDKSNP